MRPARAIRLVGKGRVTWERVPGDYPRPSRVTYFVDGAESAGQRAFRELLIDGLAIRRRRPRRVVLTATGQQQFQDAQHTPPPADAGPTDLTTPEGVRITDRSAGPRTATDVARILSENKHPAIGAHLSVRLQDQYPSQITLSVSGMPGAYRSISAVMYLQGRNAPFVHNPDGITAHEVGHDFGYHALYLVQQGDWTPYLTFRGIHDDDRLDSRYEWDRDEIIAEDWRLCFGSEKVIRAWPNHLLGAIPHPRDVPGLREFLSEWGREKVA